MTASADTVRDAAADTPIASILHARSVCVVGASPNTAGLGGQAVERLRRHGFAGRLELVNPRYENIDGHPCHPSIATLPEPTDVAVICVNAQQVPDLILECGAAGISTAVVIASGFDEVAGADELSARLRDAIRTSGVRVVGPNTEGVWSVPSRVFLTFGTASARTEFRPGPVSVLSQSGGIGTAIVRHLQERGVGARYFVGVGNEADLTALDFLDQIVREAEPGVVVVYTEGLRDGHRLGALMSQAHAVGIQVVLLRAGTSSQGRAATASHTGRVASETRVYSDLLRQYGVIEVASMAQTWAAAESLVSASALRGAKEADLRPAAVGIVSVSGGCRGLIADAAAGLGVAISTFRPETVARLTEWLPSYAVATNPVDPTGSVLRDPPLLDRIVGLVASDPSHSVVLLQLGNSALGQIDRHADALAAIAAGSGTPIVIGTVGDDVSVSRRAALLSRGLIVAPDPYDAVQRCRWLLAAA